MLPGYNLLEFPFPLEASEVGRVVEVRRDARFGSGVYEKMAVNFEVFGDANPLDVVRHCADAEMNATAAKIAGKSKAFFADCPPQEVAVYVIAPESGCFAKIGVANNPNSRLAGLQTAHFEKLAIHALFWCQNTQEAYGLENKAHKAATMFERRGEWFGTDPITAAIVVAETAAREGFRIASSEMWLRHRQLVRQQVRYWNDGGEPEGDLRVVA